MSSLPSFLLSETGFVRDRLPVSGIECRGRGNGRASKPFSIRGSFRIEENKVTDNKKAFCSIDKVQMLYKRRRRRRNSLICSQNTHFRFSNVAETLHDIRTRLIKEENVALLRNYLKKRNEDENGVHVQEEVKQNVELDFPFASDCSFDVTTPRGILSPAARSCIEQFSRLCGITGKQMRRMFYAQSPQAILVQNEPRHFVEYCCFKYLSRCNDDFHPCIKDAAFRRLIFITMLAWQQPYDNDQSDRMIVYENEKIIGKDAFIRIAPVVAGIADKPTAHHLYNALINADEGLSFNVWDTFLLEILRIHEERSEHHVVEGSTLQLDAEESVLCVGANKRQPIQMWNDNNVAWPGRLTLTNRALYFEPNGIIQHQKAMKLDLQGPNGNIQKKKVGPFGVAVLDTAIVVSSDEKFQPWTLEFVDLSGGRRREAWFSFIYELLSVYSFISEFGPVENDPFFRHTYGSVNGSKKAVACAVNGIARVQAIQSMFGRLVEHPGKLLQFSYLQNAPCGELVKQSLAVGFWGGQLELNYRRLLENDRTSKNTAGTGFHIVDVDGSIYLQRWMKSPTWNSSMSSQFWKHKPGGRGLIVGKDLVVGDASHLDRAVKLSLGQSEMLERTKATIDGALVKGIPSNIDLFKELMLPFTLLSVNIRRLQKWENPPFTVLFLASCFLVLYKHWLRYFVSFLLMTSAGVVFILHNINSESTIKKVTIREPPPSNTLQKIIALKEALTEVEIQIQNVNITLLKLRSLIMVGHPQGKNLVALALLGAALVLLFVPFQYVVAFVLMDRFTSELEFRRGMVLKWHRQVREWWEAIPASPVAVLPPENQQTAMANGNDAVPAIKGETIAETVKEWFAESF